MSKPIDNGHARRVACALCGAPQSAEHAPFCSQGCRDRDLLAWLGEGYRFPATPSHEGDEAESGHDGGGGLDSKGATTL